MGIHLDNNKLCHKQMINKNLKSQLSPIGINIKTYIFSLEAISSPETFFPMNCPLRYAVQVN